MPQPKKKKMIQNRYIVLFLVTLFLSACSNTKYLPEGELLYVGGKVKIEDSLLSKSDKKTMKADLEALLRPKPNRAILGLKPKLYIYNLAGEPTKEKGFRHWLRTKVGEPPVLFSKVDLEYNASILQNYVENKGYFKARTEADSTAKNKRATADYTVHPNVRYKIKSVTFPTDSTAIDSAVAGTRRGSRLRKGRGYDLNVIKEERERIDTRLKEKGYYFFNADFILIQVDSTVGKHEVDLIVKVKEETPEQAKKIYTINDIVIYPNYTLAGDTLNKSADVVEKYKDFTIIDPEKMFNPRIFDRSLYFKKGDLYNRTNHNLSLNRLVNLGTFKFVKNQFRISDTLNNKLDAYYYLTPLPRKSIRFEILGKTNSANYTGSELSVNWSNRNTFHGAELLTISAFGGAEVQVSGQNKGYNVYRIGTEANLIWPRIIAPFPFTSSSGFVPRTKATLGYEFQNRQKLYTLNSFKGSFGYLWKENVHKEHELNITQINYVSPFNVTDEYRQKIANDTLGNSLQRIIDRQLIFGPTYSFTYTNTMEKRKKNTFYYKGSIELAGNIAGLVTGANAKKDNTATIFSVPFSQFTKMEHDFRHYLRLGRNSQLASRIIAGVGVPYGNSTELPYIRQFFIGGTNSIRAFRARAIGPGSFKVETAANSFLPDQSGDIKLELNTEYRTKLFSIVQGAVFVDAGNIWLMNKNDSKPGAEFSGRFLNELAVGTGVGLRFDLSFLVLRTDLAFPLRRPDNPEGSRWVLDQISFGNSSWRKENLVFNLAIGYPF